MPPVTFTLRPGPYHDLTRSSAGEVGRFVRGRCQAVEVAAKRNCPVDEAQLRNSSEIDVQEGPNGPVGTVTFTAPYALFVHEDTRPHWPPINALERWASRHGFPNAYLVARAISRHGTKGVPFLWDALNEVVERARRRSP